MTSSSVHRWCFALGAVCLCATHFLAAMYLPISDCDETFNFLEPIHYLLFGTGKQTWENCNKYSLRSWSFNLLYALPALLRYRILPRMWSAFSLQMEPYTISSHLLSTLFTWCASYADFFPRSVDVYFFQRVAYGQVACAAELFFVSSIKAAYSPASLLTGSTTALTALGLLVTSSTIPHAAASALPTSFSMVCFFLATGCWLRTGPMRGMTLSEPKNLEGNKKVNRCYGLPSSTSPRWVLHRSALWSSFYAGCALVLIVVVFFVGWPFAALIAVPIILDLLCRHTVPVVFATCFSLFLIVPITLHVDRFFYCQNSFSIWNLILYNALGGGDATLYGVESPFFFYKNLLVNFHFVFLMALLSPIVVLVPFRRPPNFFRLYEKRCEIREKNSKVQLKEIMRRKDLRTVARNQDADLVLYLTPVHSCFTECVYLLPFFIWFIFWHFIPHKEERFMAPAYPALVLCAAISCSRCFIHSAWEESRQLEKEQLQCITAEKEGNHTPVSVTEIPRDERVKVQDDVNSASAVHENMVLKPDTIIDKKNIYSRACFRLIVTLFFVFTGGLSLSRSMALFHFYGAPQRLLQDAYSTLSAATVEKWTVNKYQTDKATCNSSETKEGCSSYVYRLCVGKEWYRFPSSFFLDHHVPEAIEGDVVEYPVARYGFVKTASFSGALPTDFTPYSSHPSGFLLPSQLLGPGWPSTNDIPRACQCGSIMVNDRNFAFEDQYVSNLEDECDVVMDSLPYAGQKKSTFAVEGANEPSEHEEILQREGKELHLVAFPEPVLPNTLYRLLDSSRTPMWCRVLYIPFGFTDSCAVWRRMILQQKRNGSAK